MQPRVMDHETGDRLPGTPSPELIEASAAAGETGAVPAYRDAEGVWQYVQPSQQDFVRSHRHEAVRTVWIDV